MCTSNYFPLAFLCYAQLSSPQTQLYKQRTCGDVNNSIIENGVAAGLDRYLVMQDVVRSTADTLLSCSEFKGMGKKYGRKEGRRQ
jgi:hypothetical protein